jgi:pilus assembly protein CpaB
MNRRLVSVLCFALVVASVTSFLVYRLILVRVQSQSQGKTVATSKLFVAKHDLQVGTLIQDSDVDEVAWGAPIPDDAVKAKTDIVGRGVVATVFQNEPILERRLAARGAGAGLAATIPIGMRAVALRVNEVVGLAGFVLPGMRVDVLVAGNVPGSATMLCRTVLQNIEVLSAGQKIDKSSDSKPESAQVVNLLVTPAQAETLNLASESRVQLVLRNPLDTKSEVTPGTSLARMYGIPESAVSRIGTLPDPPPPNYNPNPAPKPRPVVEPIRPAQPATIIDVFHGSKRTQATFDAHGDSRGGAN